jgi:hypothetical protein
VKLHRRLANIAVNNPFVRTVWVIGALIVGVYLWLVVLHNIQRYRLDRIEAAITRATYPGQTYAQYHATLCNKLYFYYVDDWDKAEETGDGGRSVGAVTHHIMGIFDVDILVTAQFDGRRRLLYPVDMRRRMHGF